MRTTSRDRTRAWSLSALLAATLLLAGCGGDDQADAQPQPSPSSTVEGSPSGSASDSASASSSSSTGVAPATGKVIDTSLFTMRAPEHYRVQIVDEDFAASLTGPEANISVAVVDNNGHEPPLRQLAREERQLTSGLQHAPVRTTTVGGERAYLLAAGDSMQYETEVGLNHAGSFVHLNVSSVRGRSVNLRLLRSMLATWQWK